MLNQAETVKCSSNKGLAYNRKYEEYLNIFPVLENTDIALDTNFNNFRTPLSSYAGIEWAKHCFSNDSPLSSEKKHILFLFWPERLACAVIELSVNY